jgi:integrase
LPLPSANNSSKDARPVSANLELATATKKKIDLVERWLSQFRDKSRELYGYYFEEYIKWSNESPESLLEKARNDINWLDDNLRSWYIHSKEQGVEHATRKAKYMIVRSFYRWNNVALPKSPREWLLSVHKEPDRIYTREEIKAMYEHAETTRDQALLLALNGNPQRIEVLRALTWGMVAEQVEKGGIVIVNVPTMLPDARGVNCNKNATKYRFAFLSEATWKIQQMMGERREAGEIISPSSWLFRGYSKARTKNPVRVSKDSESVPLTNKSIEVIINQMAISAGIQNYYKTAKQTKGVFHPHGFRRTWKARVREVWRKINAPIDSDFLKFVIGDKLDYGGAYDKFSEPLLRQIFQELEPYISITDYWASKEKEEEDMRPQHKVETGKLGVLYGLYLELSEIYKSP